jgi:hypothetical protein
MTLVRTTLVNNTPDNCGGGHRNGFHGLSSLSTGGRSRAGAGYHGRMRHGMARPAVAGVGS